MKPYALISNFLLKCILCILLLFVTNKSAATHIVGTDMFYTHVSGNTYKITIILYGDCGPASAPLFSSLPTCVPKVCIYDGSTVLPGMPISLTIEPPSAGIEITPVCPDSIHYTQCTNPSYSIPGIKKFVYSATYTLPYASNLWRIVFNGNLLSASVVGAGRAAAITNIAGAGATFIQLEDTLNNSSVANNSSPMMTVIPTPFFCLNQLDGYNPGVVDADGDNLVFDLVSAKDGTYTACTIGGNVTYTGVAWPGQPVTATTPLRCAASTFSFDALTGQISFFPNFIQRAVVVYNIREFRGGVFVGSCQREMTFLVRPCINLPPSGIYNTATAGTITDSTHFRICSNVGAFSIFMNPTDFEGNGITVSVSGLPAGATFTTTGNGTTTPHSTFSWNTTGLAPGSYVFFVTFTDNNCPEAGTLTRAFTVTIYPSPLPVTGTFTLCAGSTTALANATPGGSWSSSTPSVATVGSSSGVVSGIGTGTSTISYIMPNGCFETAVVTVNPSTIASITGPTNLCIGSSITLSHSIPGGTWSTSSAVITLSPTGVVSGIAVGTATISYTAVSCMPVTTTLVVTVSTLPVVSPITGPTFVCEASTITLADATPGGVWISGSSNASVTAIGVVTGVAAGTAIISYGVTNICGTTYAVKTITVNPLPVAGTISGPMVVCVGSTIVVTHAGAAGTWTIAPASVATITSGGIVTGIVAGTSTISYTVTNSCGAVSATSVITVNTLPVVAPITGPSVVCVGATIALADATPGGVWSCTISNASVSATGVVTGVAAGTATISYSVTNMCGTVVATKLISVDTTPVAGAISGPGTVCEGSTISLTTTGTGGVWSSTVPAVATISAGGVVTGVMAGTTVISYVVTNSCGTDFAVTTITVNPLPTVAPITGPSSVCVGLTITLSCTTPGGVWSSIGAATVSATGDVTGVSGGTATISYTITNMCGSISATKIITVNLFPYAGVISGPTELCVGETITLSETIAGGTWSGGAPNASVSSTGVVTGFIAGTATISYTVVNACGPATVSYLITVNPTPDPGTISGPTNVCEGSVITLVSTAPGGTWSVIGSAATINAAGDVTGVTAGTVLISYVVTLGPCSAAVTYAVTVNPLPHAGPISGGPMVCTSNMITMTDPVAGGVWSCTSNASITATGVLTGLLPGTATVSYAVTNVCGTDIATKVVTINLTPDPGTLSGPSTVCVGGLITISSTAPGGVWSSTNPSVAPITTGGLVLGASAGTTIISYFMNTGLCSSYVARIVNVDPLPSPGVISADSIICEGASITLSSSVSGGTWSSSGGAGTVTAAGVLTGLSSGTVVVSYTVSNSCGPAAAMKMILVSPRPDPGEISGPSTVCLGFTVTLTDIAPGPGIWSSSNTAVATISADGVVTSVALGTTMITFTVTTSIGCSNSVSHLITVAPPPPKGVISGSPLACLLSDMQLHETEPGGTWSCSNPTVATIDMSSGLVHPLMEGTVMITYTTAPSANGCSNVATFQLAILLTAPFHLYPTTKNASCNGFADGSITVTPTGSSGPWEYLWVTGATTSTLNNLAAGSYRVDVRDLSSGCRGASIYLVKEPEPVRVLPTVKDDGCDQSIGSIKLTVSGGVAPYVFRWYDNSSAAQVSNLPKGVYSVVVTDNHKCEQHLDVDVPDGGCDDITVQDGVSPNGDGANDYWVIKGLENYRNNLVQLFDKWGDKVFEQKGYDNTWDGRGRNGMPLPDGTYFYIIRLNAENGAGGKNVMTGPLLIKR
jgi:trimeric autotransporter adhesin